MSSSLNCNQLDEQIQWKTIRSCHRKPYQADCRVCNRRRVKCDRRLPTCLKCEKKGLICSGYGLILKWDQGVASRGNLKGKKVPLPFRKASSSNLDVVATLSNLTVAPKEPAKPIVEVLPQSNLEINTVTISNVSRVLLNSDYRRLLHHFDHNVAPNMAWANSTENPWRHILIPMALQSPALLASVLAFAAKHIDAIKFPSHSGIIASIPSSQAALLQHRAAKLLAQEVRDLTTIASSGTALQAKKASRDRSNAILATMLVLTNVETVWPDSSVWQIHLKAARTVLATRRSTFAMALDDPSSIFLEQELFIASTFASTTNFLSPISEDGPRPEPLGPSSLFVEFLKLLEMVTSLERQATTNPSVLLGVTLSGLRKLFENARSRVQPSKTFDHLHLGRTVNCFYHAGLIYACRALLKGDSDSNGMSRNERDIQIATSTVELFRLLDFAGSSKPTSVQDLVWPLFITGTEASSTMEQDMVTTKLQQAISGTGFSNNQHALEFLKALWQRKEIERNPNTDFDWITFARKWTGQGRTFLVF